MLGGGLLQPQVLAERGLALGVDITVPRRVMVVSVRDLARYTDTAAGQKRIDQLETAVSGLVEGEAGGIILRNAARQILLLRARPDAQMQAMAQRLCVMARERFGLRLAVGIDGGAPDVHRAYAQANKAWRSARMAPEGVLPYDCSQAMCRARPRKNICVRYFGAALTRSCADGLDFWRHTLRRRVPSRQRRMHCISTKTLCSTV